jgi:GTP-binding protein Era
LTEFTPDTPASDGQEPPAQPRRAGFAAIIGAPNAGKSTLVNRLVGAKVSIVTRKVQTTRFPVKGVAISGQSQIVLVDTPGIFTPRRRLDRAMVRSAWGGAKDADAVVHLVDAASEIAVEQGASKAADRRSADDVESIIEGLKHAPGEAILAINKIDLVKRDLLLGLSQKLFESGVYSEVFMISAANGSGVEDLKLRLAALMPSGQWLYPEDQTADLPVRLLAAEITREKIYLRVHEELPYAAAVETTLFEEAKNGSVRIEQNIYVERDSQRPILLGKGGQTLKWIGENARKDLIEILDRPVHLFLHVKVRENWQEEREFYAGLGLEFDV